MGRESITTSHQWLRSQTISHPITAEQRPFLAHPPQAVARIATVDANGEPHVVSGGWAWDDVAGELVLTGRDVARTARARHVRDNGRAAVSIDGVQTGGGWAPWAFLARGAARVDETAGTIRLHPTWTRSWGLEHVSQPAGG